MINQQLYYPDTWRYHTTIVSIRDFRQFYLHNFATIREEFSLAVDQFEYLYDWLVTEAVAELASVYGARLQYHVSHDVYHCVYDAYGDFIEKMIAFHFDASNIRLYSNCIVKVLVAADTLIISRG